MKKITVSYAKCNNESQISYVYTSAHLQTYKLHIFHYIPVFFISFEKQFLRLFIVIGKLSGNENGIFKKGSFLGPWKIRDLEIADNVRAGPQAGILKLTPRNFSSGIPTRTVHQFCSFSSANLRINNSILIIRLIIRS